MKVVGIYQRKFSFQHAKNSGVDGSGLSQDEPEPTDEEALDDWMISLIKTMRADMDNDKLYPPGMVYIMVRMQLRDSMHDADGEVYRNTLTCSLRLIRKMSAREREGTRRSFTNRHIER